MTKKSETQSVIVQMPRQMHRRVKQFAKQDYGNNMSQLVRAAIAEFLAEHYGEEVSPHVDWGGFREEDDAPGQWTAEPAL